LQLIADTLDKRNGKPPVRQIIRKADSATIGVLRNVDALPHLPDRVSWYPAAGRSDSGS